MRTDIILENDNVKIEGKTTITGTDLQIDAQERRKSNGGYRRAMVHDFEDGLTINWRKDYPGGVTIFGKTAVTDDGSNGVSITPGAYNPNSWPKFDQSPANTRQLDLINELSAIKRVVIQLRKEVTQIWSVLLNLESEEAAHPLLEGIIDQLQQDNPALSDLLRQQRANLSLLRTNPVQPQNPISPIPRVVNPLQKDQADIKKSRKK